MNEREVGGIFTSGQEINQVNVSSSFLCSLVSHHFDANETSTALPVDITLPLSGLQL